jgi:hypothetical protein
MVSGVAALEVEALGIEPATRVLADPETLVAAV